MTSIETDAYHDIKMDKSLYQPSIKEKAAMQDQDVSALSQRYADTGRSANSSFDRDQRDLAMTLARLVCYERNRTGTKLTHKPCNERPQRLCLANLMH